MLEGLVSNIFIVTGGGAAGAAVVETAGGGVLPGQMRQIVLDVCVRNGIEVKLRSPRMSESSRWREVFLTSSVKTVTPVRRIRRIRRGNAVHESPHHSSDQPRAASVGGREETGTDGTDDQEGDRDVLWEAKRVVQVQVGAEMGGDAGGEAGGEAGEEGGEGGECTARIAKLVREALSACDAWALGAAYGEVGDEAAEAKVGAATGALGATGTTEVTGDRAGGSSGDALLIPTTLIPGYKPTREPPILTLLVDNYDSYTFNLFQQLARVNGQPPVVIRNDAFRGDWTLAATALHNACARQTAAAAAAGGFGRSVRIANVVISPGPGHPDVAVDFGLCADAIRSSVGVNRLFRRTVNRFTCSSVGVCEPTPPTGEATSGATSGATSESSSFVSPMPAMSAVPAVPAAMAGLPLLGVCLGHQGLATTLGGKVIRAPSGVAHGVRWGNIERDREKRQRMRVWVGE
jgi:anthranilate/para-aminobenzoate synthase component II